MPEAGVEPARPEGHRPLKTARLPVPPLRLRGRCRVFGGQPQHYTVYATLIRVAIVVAQGGVEPPTPRFSAGCSTT